MNENMEGKLVLVVARAKANRSLFLDIYRGE